ncbi:MAG: penicillin-binding protein 1A [Cyanobacteria bacterium P01_F01_bin.42]
MAPSALQQPTPPSPPRRRRSGAGRRSRSHGQTSPPHGQTAPLSPESNQLQSTSRAKKQGHSSERSGVKPARPKRQASTVRKKYRQRLRNKASHRLGRLSLAALGLTCAGGAGCVWLESTLPNTNNIEAATLIRPGTITYSDQNGSAIYQVGPATRTYTGFNEIPKQLKEAFLATEDRRFYEHDGIDLYGIMRATVKNITTGALAEGGSTLTQQLARISFLNQERSLLRKLKEARISQKIEAKLSKDEILERYLNQVYLGAGAYGVADAAWVYFGKPLSQLTLPEMATIAGLPAAPSTYSPLVNPDIAQERRDLVLFRMAQADYISEAERKAAETKPLSIQEQLPPNSENHAPYFTTYIQAELEQLVPKAALEAGGLNVQTSLNRDWQSIAAKTIEETVKTAGADQDFDQGAMVAIDPKTGGIAAMVGGSSFQESQFNRVTQAQRQPGSTFKMFVYAAAIAAGFPPSDGYLDAPLLVDGYRPKNYSGKYKGWVSMSQSLTHSYNIPAVRVLIDVGFKPTLDLAQSLGIQSKLEPFYSTALGSNEVNLLEMTNAYSSVAAQGLYNKPRGIQSVTNRQGEVIYSSPQKPRRVLDQDSASIMTWMLEDVVSDGTGVNAKLNRPVAGKTGTSEDYRDLWFIGYIPQLVAGVWLGNDDNRPTQGTSATAAQTWHTFMQQITKQMPVEPFPNIPKLEGRKGSIEAEPIQPKQMLTENLPPESEEYRDEE